jgi:hypothetical protein
MPTIYVPDLPEYSGLNNDELGEILRLGLALKGYRAGPRLLVVPLSAADGLVLDQSAERAGMGPSDYVAALIREGVTPAALVERGELWGEDDHE